MHVLGGDPDRGAGAALGHCAQGEEGGADHDLRAVGAGRPGQEGAEELLGLGHRLAHLPVRCDVGPSFAHDRAPPFASVLASISASTPGSRLPSSSSSEAPPPVLEPVDPIGEAELPQRGDRVAAADHGGRLALGDRLGQDPGAVGERLQLEGAHRTVPEHRPGSRDLVPRNRAPCAGRCRAPSSPRGPRSRRRPGAPPPHRSGRRAPGPPGGADRSRMRSAFSSALAASSTPASSTSESPVESPWARKKLKHIAPPIRISSAVSRKRSITPDLVADLGAAEDDHQGALGIGDHAAQLLELALEQEAGVGGKPVGDPLGRRMGAVGRAEGVVDVDLGELGKVGRQLGVVVGLAGLEAAVLEQQDPSRLQRPGHRRRPLADDLGGELDLAPRSAPRAARPPASSRAPGRALLPVARGGRRG